MKFLKDFIYHKAHIHLITTCIITLLGSMYSLYVGVLIAGLLSIAKEMIDQSNGGQFSMIDILGDAIGILLGVAIILFTRGI